MIHARWPNSVESVVWVGRMHHFPRDYGVNTQRGVNVEYSFTECGIKGERVIKSFINCVCLFVCLMETKSCLHAEGKELIESERKYE